jgi:hypothetical protein
MEDLLTTSNGLSLQYLHCPFVPMHAIIDLLSPFFHLQETSAISPWVETEI